MMVQNFPKENFEFLKMLSFLLFRTIWLCCGPLCSALRPWGFSRFPASELGVLINLMAQLAGYLTSLVAPFYFYFTENINSPWRAYGQPMNSLWTFYGQPMDRSLTDHGHKLTKILPNETVKTKIKTISKWSRV